MRQRVQRTLGDCWQWKANGQCSKGDNCSFRHDINKRARMTRPNPSPSSFMQQNERNTSRTQSVVRHADIRDQNPSLGMICPGDPQQRNPNASKFEDRSQEETEWQERCSREAAWRLAKSILLKLKEKDKTAFFSPSENWCLPAPSTLKPEEREFVVDSGASMHMISQKGLELC